MADVLKIEPTEDPAVDVLATIDKVRALAEDGELSSVSIAYVLRNGRGGQKWSGLPNVSLAIGSAARLLHHLNKAADEC